MIDIGADEYWQAPIDAKLTAYGQPIELNRMIVTAAFDGAFYVESDDRTSGIRVENANHGMAVGMRANVAGSPSGNVNGERCIVATAVSRSGVGSVAPILLTNSALGGGRLGWQEAVWGWRLVGDDPVRTWTFDVGLNNIGLLVTTTGTVKQIDTAAPAAWFVIDDGSGVNVKVVVPEGVAVGSVGQQVRVTGISSCERSDIELHRALRVRTQSDISAL